MAILVSLFCTAAAAQRLALGSTAAPAKAAGGSDAYCVSLTDGYRACRVRTGEGPEAELVVERNGESVHRISGGFWSMANAGPEDFVAYRGDLDLDGKAEIVLVTLDGVSNGLGVSYSTAHILDGKALGSGAKPLSFPIQEFGPADSFVYNPRSRRTEILISYWAEHDSLDPERPTGVYLVGKWFRYRDGLLEPSLERPTRARRLLDSFAAERDNRGFGSRRPNAWLSDRRARRFTAGPHERTKPISIKLAKITSYKEQEAEGAIATRFEFETDEGEKIAASTERGGDSDTALRVAGFGIWKGWYMYPMSWGMDLRLSTFMNNVEGRRVRIDVHETEAQGKFAVVWLL